MKGRKERDTVPFAPSSLRQRDSAGAVEDPLSGHRGWNLFLTAPMHDGLRFMCDACSRRS